MNHKLGPARNQPCVRCGGRAANWHERIPRSRGGPRDRFNAVALCGSGTTGCHGLVTANPMLARSEDLTVPGRIIRGVYQGPDERYREHYRAVAS